MIRHYGCQCVNRGAGEQACYGTGRIECIFVVLERGVVADFQPRGYLRRNLGAEVPSLVVVSRALLQHSLAVVQSARYAVADLVVSSIHAEIVFPGRSRVVEEIIVPVEVAVVFVLPVLFHHPRTLGILDLVVAPDPQFVVVDIIVVGILRPLVCGEEHVDDSSRVVTSCLEVGGCRRGTEAETAVVGDVGLAIVS